ncbi:hypothetical protein B0H19DRAFT_1234023 [Mycena capillaripes]|nr:hypothetical protein B0H19DRAFT_1234023 [Mycena capillaripes]
MYSPLLKTFISGIWIYVFRTLYSIYLSSKRQHGLPPGPPTLPFIGNIHIFPRQQLQYKFTEWAKIYGDVFSLKVMHLTIIVLNSPTTVKEVIDKRGATSSNRPASIMVDIVTPDNVNLGSGRYGNDRPTNRASAGGRNRCVCEVEQQKALELGPVHSNDKGWERRGTESRGKTNRVGQATRYRIYNE